MYCKMELDSTAFMQGIKTSGAIRLRGILDSLQVAALHAELRRKVYTDAKSVAQWIKCTFGVSYTPQGTVDLPTVSGSPTRRRRKCLARQTHRNCKNSSRSWPRRLGTSTVPPWFTMPAAYIPRTTAAPPTLG